jgi:hypothetical protein
MSLGSRSGFATLARFSMTINVRYRAVLIAVTDDYTVYFTRRIIQHLYISEFGSYDRAHVLFVDPVFFLALSYLD